MKTIACALSMLAVVGETSAFAGADGYAGWEGATNHNVMGGTGGATNVPSRFYRIRLVHRRNLAT